MSGRAAARVAVSSAVFFAGAAAALAHDFWIEPSTYTPDPGALVQVRLRVGEHLKGEPVPRRPSRIERFFAIGSGGESPVEGSEGAEPAGAVRVGGPGVTVIGYRSRQSYVELDPAAFEKYLVDEGLQRIIASRLERGQSDRRGRELYSRCAKSLVVAGGEAAGHDRRLGFPLELIAEKSPYVLAGGGELPIRLLYREQPLAGALVVAIGEREPDRKLAARTDAQGRVVFDLPRAGAWLVKCVHMIEASGAVAEWESLWASLTFQVPEGEGGAAPAR